uniref:aralkylamine N-acetyltransferase n=2 Tax=Caenorhabditis japonica TaxID=281687 RepID=A0A8R1DST4_CAEJA
LSEYFFKEEPFTRASGAPLEEMRPIFGEMVQNSLKQPFSLIVISETGDVAAVLLNSLWNREDSFESAGDQNENNNCSPAIQGLVRILNQCHVDFWKLCPPNVNTVLYREISSVGSPWQRKGIATRMVTEWMTPSRIAEYNVGGVVSATSSFANQTLLAKQGFKCLKEYAYSDIVNCKGERLIETDDGSKAMRLNFKNIEEFGIDLH